MNDRRRAPITVAIVVLIAVVTWLALQSGDDKSSRVHSTTKAGAVAELSAGERFFNARWQPAPGPDPDLDGLGPVFAATSCASCHPADERPDPTAHGDQILSVQLAGPDGRPDPSYGNHLQPLAINELPGEGRPVASSRPIPDSAPPDQLETINLTIENLAHGPLDADTELLLRLAPPLHGVGQLQLIPRQTLEQLADPDDADDDGISGRVGPGRFGWKAQQPTLADQVIDALDRDLGITSPDRPTESCTEAQTDCRRQPSGGSPEITHESIQRLTAYVAEISPPQDTSDPGGGATVFDDIGCSSCHVANPAADEADVELTARPYTDLLLHDLGPGLADPTGPNAQEWRTAPLWGLNLAGPNAAYLHDGRARTLDEAIRWHDGEAAASVREYEALGGADREELMAFLRTR